MVHQSMTAMGAFFLSIFLIISGCSQTDLALRYADQFIAWEIKDQFGFDGQQKQKVDVLSKKAIQQLKTEFIPEIVDTLKLVKVEFLKRNWNEQSIDDGFKFLNENRLKFKHLGQKSLKLLSSYSTDFSQITKDKNWQIFVENFKQKNQEILEEKPKSRFPDILDRFLGDLNGDQIQLMKSNKDLFTPDPNLRIKNRDKILGQFIQNLTPYSKEAFAQNLNDFFTNHEKWNDSQVIKTQEIRHEKQMQILAQILKVMTAKQKKNLIEEWDELIQDLENGAK